MSRFLDDLEALLKSHSTDARAASDERLLRAVAGMLSNFHNAMMVEIRGARGGASSDAEAQLSARTSAMIRYRPDWDRGAARSGAMIRYRPDWDRGEARSGAMIRYRPDWDRTNASGDSPSEPFEQARAFLEPMMKDIAERLGPDEAKRAFDEALKSVGLSRSDASLDNK